MSTGAAMSAGKGKKMLLILSIFLSFFVLVLHGIPSTGGIWFFRFGLWENLSLRIWENLFLLIPLPIGAGLALVAAVFCADPGVGPDGARSWRRKSLGNLVLDDGLCFLVPSLGKGSGGFLGRFLCFIFKVSRSYTVEAYPVVSQLYPWPICVCLVVAAPSTF
ncbi:hypothetical protein V6N13_051336 [Hibiscus sabdariffa]